MEKNYHLAALILYFAAIICIVAAIVTHIPIFTIFGVAAMVIGWAVKSYASKKFGGNDEKR